MPLPSSISYAKSLVQGQVEGRRNFVAKTWQSLSGTSPEKAAPLEQHSLREARSLYSWHRSKQKLKRLMCSIPKNSTCLASFTISISLSLRTRTSDYKRRRVVRSTLGSLQLACDVLAFRNGRDVTRRKREKKTEKAEAHPCQVLLTDCAQPKE